MFYYVSTALLLWHENVAKSYIYGDSIVLKFCGSDSHKILINRYYGWGRDGSL